MIQLIPRESCTMMHARVEGTATIPKQHLRPAEAGAPTNPPQHVQPVEGTATSPTQHLQPREAGVRTQRSDKHMTPTSPARSPTIPPTEDPNQGSHSPTSECPTVLLDPADQQRAEVQRQILKGQVHLYAIMSIFFNLLT